MKRTSFAILLLLLVFAFASCRSDSPAGPSGPTHFPEGNARIRGFALRTGEVILPSPMAGVRAKLVMLGGLLSETYITDSTGWFEARVLPGDYLIEPQPSADLQHFIRYDTIAVTVHPNEIVLDTFYFGIGDIIK